MTPSTSEASTPSAREDIAVPERRIQSNVVETWREPADVRALLWRTLNSGDHTDLERLYIADLIPQQFKEITLALLSSGDKTAAESADIDAITSVAGRRFAAMYALKLATASDAHEQKIVQFRTAMVLLPGSSIEEMALKGMIVSYLATDRLENALRTANRYHRRFPNGQFYESIIGDIAGSIQASEEASGVSFAIMAETYIEVIRSDFVVMIALAVAERHLTTGRAELSLRSAQLAATRVKMGTNEYARTLLYLMAATVLRRGISQQGEVMEMLRTMSFSKADRRVFSAMWALAQQVKLQNLRFVPESVVTSTTEEKLKMPEIISRAASAIKAADAIMAGNTK